MKRRKTVSKKELGKWVKRNKSNRAIARYFKVSESTIKRRVKQYGLRAVRPRGRKPYLKTRPRRFPKPKDEWVDVKRYFDTLDNQYHFIQPRYPPHKYINPRTKVCSFKRGNPKGKYTTVGIYFVTLQSKVYFLYYTRIRYSRKPVPFQEIYNWISGRVDYVLDELYLKASFSIEQVVAFTFMVER